MTARDALAAAVTLYRLAYAGEPDLTDPADRTTVAQLVDPPELRTAVERLLAQGAP